MKQLYLLFFVFSSVVGLSQSPIPTIKLKQGDFIAPKIILENIDPDNFLFKDAVFENRLYLFLQFKSVPSFAENKVLIQKGIELLDYVPDNTFLVRINGFVSKNELKQLKVVNTVSISSLIKLDPTVAIHQQELKKYSEQTIELLVTGFKGIGNEKLIQEFLKKDIKAEVYKKGWEGAVKVTVASGRIDEIAKASFVYYVEEFPAAEIPLNNESGVSHGTSGLQNSLPGIGRNLSGKGVVIGMGDIGGASHHIDHYYKTIEPWPSGVYHSSHVAGIMAGAGLIDPTMKGRAPGASLVVDFLSEISFLTPQYYRQFGMLLTNNSYGTTATNCQVFGGYNSTSRFIDQQLVDYPDILHIYAAGNEVARNCSPFPIGYQTVFAGGQSSKNTLTVGGSNKDELTNYYSKGPTKDGRIKPEITAIGRNVFSTVPFNVYGSNSGTSMACPQVTGSLALLIERYRQLNNGLNPPGGLLKNIICNATTDVGNTGPDFANGFGSLDVLPAVEILEKKNYYASSIQNAGQQTSSFTVGSSISEVKVMLYWPDKAASLFTNITLVNDLDIFLTAPDGRILKPLLLNPNPGAVLNTAITGEDHTNNMEQVIIRNPIPGNYTITIKGFLVPFGSQPFFVSYSVIDKGLKMIAPIKKDRWKSGETQFIKWDEPGENPSGYNVEYSIDGGNNWQLFGTSSGNTKRLTIQVPIVTTTNTKIRITNKSSGISALVDSLMITPELDFNIGSTCSGIISVNWPRVPEIDSFAVSMIVAGQMKEMGTTKDTFFTIRNLNIDSVYWVSISPIKNGFTGERAIAKSIKPIGTGCTLPEFDGDILVSSLISPVSGRKNTSIDRGSTEKISIQLQNLDNEISSTPIVIKIFVNNFQFDQDTITTPISAYGNLIHTFKNSIDLSQVGEYWIRVIAEKTGDPTYSNNILEKRIRILPNQPILLPFEENFELLKDTVYRFPGYFGLEGSDRWDYSADNNTGFLKTVVGASNKALLPSKLPVRPLSVINTLTATYNLSNYSKDDNIFLTYNRDNNLGLGQYYLRGSDTSSWIPVSFFSSSIYANIHRNVTQILNSQQQQISSSFQLKFEPFKTSISITAPDTIPYLNNLSIYRVTDDLDVIDIRTDGGRYFSEDTVTVSARVVNNTNKRVDNIILKISTATFFVNDTISFINAYDTLQLVNKILAPAVQATSSNIVGAKVICSTDSYIDNNERLTLVTVSPVLDSLPYFESFEGDTTIWNSNSFYYRTTNQFKDRFILSGGNGKKYWYKANVSDNMPDVRLEVITSQGIDISKLKNAYLSFSTARYLRQGRDSSFVQISNNRGTSWQKLNAVNSYNWYDFKNNSVWSDSNKVYWHSVTCQLPDTSKKIMLRILTFKIDSFKSPTWLGSTAIDDIHIYSLDKIVADSLTQSGNGTISSTGNGWKEIDINGEIIAAINFNGQNPGSLNWQFIPSAGLHTILNGQKLLKNRWIFKTDNTLLKPIRMRLYFSDAEVELLRRLNKCNGCIDTVSAYNFGIYQYKGVSASINSLKYDNVVSRYKSIDAAAFNLIPYANGYYAEFETELDGEFYIQMPERFSNPYLNFVARPVNNNAVSVSWSVGIEKEIEKYIIEKAVGDDAFESGNFSSVAEQPAGTALTYSYDDKLVDKSVRTYYRLKVIYKNGYVRYSTDQAVTFQRAGSILIYPNPSNGFYTITIPETNGGELNVQLVNNLGQVVLTTKREPSGRLDDMKIDIRSALYPPGVYILKVNNGHEVKSFKLIKQ